MELVTATTVQSQQKYALKTHSVKKHWKCEWSVLLQNALKNIKLFIQTL